MNHVVVQQNDHNLVILLYLIKLKKKKYELLWNSQQLQAHVDKKTWGA